MSFSNDWENCYAGNTHLSVWPWSDIVSLVHRHCKPLISSGSVKVLELGCGAGANIPLFLALGWDYYGVEGSPTIVSKLHQRYPDLVTKILVGDFTVSIPFNETFDLVIDRASLTHNTTSSIINALEISLQSLNSGGIFIGSDWFSVNHSDYTLGEKTEDIYTRVNYSKGQFLGVGKVHFSDEIHIRSLLKNFDILYLEEKEIRSYEPKNDHKFSSWNFVARKKS